MNEEVLFIFTILLLMLLSAFFSITESSIFSLQRYQVNLIKKKSSSGKLLERFIKNPATIIATILLLDEIINVTITSLISSKLNYSLVGVIPYELISIIAIFVTAILILVFCEIIPKTIGVKFARKLAIKVAPIIYYLSKAMAPISFTIDWLSKYVIKLVSSLQLDNISTVDPGSKITTLIDIGEDEGSVKTSESKIIDNLLSLQRINLTRILTPEPDLFLLPAQTNRDEALVKVKQRGFSRIPIYDGDSDNIIGILYAKDLLTHDSSEIHTILNKPYFVPDKKNVFELLRELQIKKTHMAIVLDEYGRLEGIVTLEDILEEIFGEIEDEKEVGIDSTVFRGGILYIGGGLRINDFNSSCLFAALRYGGIENIGEEISNSTIPVDQDIETIGGYIFTQLGRLPNEGESIIYGNIRLKVLTLENNRITRVSVERVND